MIEHKYVVLQTSWGINIVVYGDVYKYMSDDRYENMVQINEFLYLYCDNKYSEEPNKLGDEEFDIIKDVMFLLKEQIIQNSKFHKTVVMIRGLKFSICDYQKEGLSLAIMQWLAKVFNFNLPEVPVKYDHVLKKYVFDFSGIEKYCCLIN